MNKRTVWSVLSVVLGLSLLVTSAFTVMPTGGGGDKVWICHASGLDGTLKFESLYISKNALGAHFNNNGTPKAGHEDDYMGKCQATPTATNTKKPTKTPTQVFTVTASATATFTPTDTNTPEPTFTNTVVIPTNTQIVIPTDTATLKPTETKEPTETQEPTSTEVTATLVVPTGTPVIVITETTIPNTPVPTQVETVVVTLTTPVEVTPTLGVTATFETPVLPTATDPAGMSCQAIWNKMQEGPAKYENYWKMFVNRGCAKNWATKTPVYVSTGAGDTTSSSPFGFLTFALGLLFFFGGLGSLLANKKTII